MASGRFIVGFSGPLRVAFSVDDVQEVLAPREPTRLFHVAPSILGVINLRGRILPVVDLAALLGERGDGDDARLLVLQLELEGQRASFAARVGRIEPLREVSTIEPLPPGVPERTARAARGLIATTAGAAIVIDPLQIAELEELQTLRRR